MRTSPALPASPGLASAAVHETQRHARRATADTHSPHTRRAAAEEAAAKEAAEEEAAAARAKAKAAEEAEAEAARRKFQEESAKKAAEAAAAASAAATAAAGAGGVDAAIPGLVAAGAGAFVAGCALFSCCARTTRVSPSFLSCTVALRLTAWMTLASRSGCRLRLELPPLTHSRIFLRLPLRRRYLIFSQDTAPLLKDVPPPPTEGGNKPPGGDDKKN